MSIENDGDIDVNWFEEVDFSVAQIQNEFLWEVFSNAVILHEEDHYSMPGTISGDIISNALSMICTNTWRILVLVKDTFMSMEETILFGLFFPVCSSHFWWDYRAC